jgi:hypothetical protein
MKTLENNKMYRWKAMTKFPLLYWKLAGFTDRNHKKILQSSKPVFGLKYESKLPGQKAVAPPPRSRYSVTPNLPELYIIIAALYGSTCQSTGHYRKNK